MIGDIFFLPRMVDQHYVTTWVFLLKYKAWKNSYRSLNLEFMDYQPKKT
jgi:hypothetical protein